MDLASILGGKEIVLEIPQFVDHVFACIAECIFDNMFMDFDMMFKSSLEDFCKTLPSSDVMIAVTLNYVKCILLAFQASQN